MADPTPADAPEAQEPEPGKADTQDVSSLPQWAQDQLAKARKDAANYRTKLRETEPLARQAQELLDAQKTAEQKLADQLQTEQSARQAAERETMRLRVLAEAQLPPQLHKFVLGDNEDEMRAAAEELKTFADTEPKPGPRPDLSQGAHGKDVGGDPATDFAKFMQGQLQR